LFTSLKGDVQRAESIAIAMIADKTEKPKFNFNKIEPLAFANKGYINQGDSLDLSVMIAAYDSTQDLKLRYWEEDSTRSGDPILFEGEATRKLGLGADKGVGKHFVYGQIEVEENGGKKWKDWNFEYFVSNNYMAGTTVKIADLEVMTRTLGEMNWSDAKKKCAGLGAGWRLPTKDELELLYENKISIGGFANNFYWSSTDRASKAWCQNFGNQTADYAPKVNVGYVRAVRDF
jgi:hypothetical protein